MGGKDEFGIQSDLIEEFSLRDMKVFPTYARMPTPLSGFAATPIKKGLVAIAGGNTGSVVTGDMYFMTLDD